MYITFSFYAQEVDCIKPGLHLHLALTHDHQDPIKQIGSSANQDTARLHLFTSYLFPVNLLN